MQLRNGAAAAGRQVPLTPPDRRIPCGCAASSPRRDGAKVAPAPHPCQLGGIAAHRRVEPFQALSRSARNRGGSPRQRVGAPGNWPRPPRRRRSWPLASAGGGVVDITGQSHKISLGRPLRRTARARRFGSATGSKVARILIFGNDLFWRLPGRVRCDLKLSLAALAPRWRRLAVERLAKYVA
jgi:hypothetical protein